MRKRRAILELIKILNKTHDFISRPENDFTYSGWQDCQDALDEIDSLILRLKKNDMPDKLEIKILFAPTGPVQEVSLSGGWSEEYLVLAYKFDGAIAEVYK